MSAINLIRGHKSDDNSIVYKEKLSNGLWFYVVCRYASSYTKNKHAESCEMYINGVVTNGQSVVYTSNNGVMSFDNVTRTDDILYSDKFEDIKKEDVYTKDNFKVYLADYDNGEYTHEYKGKKERKKYRKLQWLVDVPKKDLLKFCLNRL